MKLSAKLRLLGFIMCCAGAVSPVAGMYLLKLITVDHVQISTSWFQIVFFFTILVVSSGAVLLRYSVRLSKEGK